MMVRKQLEQTGLRWFGVKVTGAERLQGPTASHGEGQGLWPRSPLCSSHQEPVATVSSPDSKYRDEENTRLKAKNVMKN